MTTFPSNSTIRFLPDGKTLVSTDGGKSFTPLKTDRIQRTNVKNKHKEVKEVSEVDKAKQLALTKAAIKLFTESANNPKSFGNNLQGFISLAESVKPKGEKKDPTPSRVSGDIPGAPELKTTPTNKSNVDTLTGKTTKANVVLKKIFTDQSPKGIKKVLRDELQKNETEIKTAMTDANKALEDPEVQDQFRALGLDPDAIVDIKNQADQNITSFIDDDQASLMTADITSISTSQMTQLGNPFGSFKSKIEDKLTVGGIGPTNISIGDPIAPGGNLQKTLSEKLKLKGLPSSVNDVMEQNPLGSLGVDFGNIQGAIASSSQGLLPQKDKLDTAFQVSNGIDAETGVKIPDIVKDGKTQLAKVMDKGFAMTAEPTTPVAEIGTTKTNDQQKFLYTVVHGRDELIIELRSARRKIENINVGWTGSASDAKLTAKEYNEFTIQTKKLMAALSGADDLSLGGWAHYYIDKAGIITRILPIEKFGNFNFGNFFELPDLTSRSNLMLETGVSVQFDAGHSVASSEKTEYSYSSKSINDKQYASFDLLLKSFIEVFPGAKMYSWDQFFNDPKQGPGFEVTDYAKKFGTNQEKIVLPAITNSAMIKEPQKPTTASQAQFNIDLCKGLSDNDGRSVTFDTSVNQFKGVRPFKSEVDPNTFQFTGGEVVTTRYFNEVRDALDFAFIPISRTNFARKYDAPLVEIDPFSLGLGDGTPQSIVEINEQRVGRARKYGEFRIQLSNNKKKKLEAPTTSPVNETGQGTLETQLKDDES